MENYAVQSLRRRGIDPVPQKFCFHPEKLPIPPEFGMPDDESTDYLGDIKDSYKDN